MSMHSTVFFKEREGIILPFADPIHGGSQPPAVAAYGNTCAQSKLPLLELSGVGNHQFITVAKKSEDQHKGNVTSPFTFSSGDGRTAENGGTTNHLHTISSLQAASMEYNKLGFGQPLICAQYPHAYGAQIAGRMMLPLSMAGDGLPIFVNAKQYNGIMRRRKSRAKVEIHRQTIKIRKPFLHLSRHLHAVRRPRGSGGRFLNTKKSDTGGEKKIQKKISEQENLHPLSTDQSQISEEAIHSTNTNDSMSTSPSSEVTSYLHHFQFNNLQASFNLPFLDLGNAGFGIAMATGNNYLQV